MALGVASCLYAFKEIHDERDGWFTFWIFCAIANIGGALS